MNEQPTPRWALWNFETGQWDEIPTENAPGEWLGGHEYGRGSVVEAARLFTTAPDGARDMYEQNLRAALLTYTALTRKP